jgi:broad specificity phosphatase PhoE
MGSVFLVRHATTAASQAGTNLGQSGDPRLTAAGEQLAARLARAITLELTALPHRETRLVSSPALRCRTTAEAIGEALGTAAGTGGRRLPMAVEEGLREIDYGAWEGLSPDQCRARDPELRREWEADPFATRAPGGESGGDVAQRAFPVLERLEGWLAADRSRVAVVVSHNHVLRLRLAALLGLPLADYRRRLTVQPGSYSVVTFGAEIPAIRRIGAMPPHGPI